MQHAAQTYGAVANKTANPRDLIAHLEIGGDGARADGVVLDQVN
jgi:hypothetical protein